jgi:phosphoribosylformylglycinamidine (FGAM) synthase-like enzyme
VGVGGLSSARSEIGDDGSHGVVLLLSVVFGTSLVLGTV